MRTLQAFCLIAVTLALASGCIGEQRYITPDNSEIWMFAIDESTPAFAESMRGNIYIVEQRIEFDFREPTEAELLEMADIGGLMVPYASLPFVRRDDIEIQIDYTLSNVSDSTITCAVTVNGINEFHEYNPGVEVVGTRIYADYAGWERSIRLGPGERLTGTIRHDELDEIAVDLATVVNGVPSPNQVVYFENESANDWRSQMYIPDVVPALTGVRMGLRLSADAASPVVLELTVRIRDTRQILVQGDDEPWILPVPVLFGPADVMAPEEP